jgi:hypothetical protein
MKIPKKDKKILESLFKYDSADEMYFLRNEEGEFIEYDDITSSEDRNLFAEKVNSIMESYFIIEGSSGTWEGRRNIVEGYAYHFENFLRRMRVDDIELFYDPSAMAVIIKGLHHDGTNWYEVRKPEWLTKNELIVSLRCGNLMEDLKSDAQYYFNKSFSKLNKTELIELYLKYLENYN